VKKKPAPRGATQRADWPAIKLAFIKGTMSTAEHAATFGVTLDAMRQRVARGKWMAERHAMSQAVTVVATAKAIRSKAEQLAEFDAQDASMSRALRGVAARMLADANKQDGRKLTASEARTIASLAEAAQKIGRIALGGTTENHGVGGLAGAPPIATSNMTPKAKKAMDDYLRDY
jgi:hypothetical protein